MGNRLSGSIVCAAIAAVAMSVSIARSNAQDRTPSSTTLKTPWGEPDLQGIWTDEFDMPLQRPAKYGDQELFTDAQRADLGNL
jgi:hypothetical protein